MIIHPSPLAYRHPASRRRADLRRAVPAVAIAGLVAVVGSLLVAPSPAHASEVALDGARAAISSSVSRGTYEQDVLSGKITVEQIVDVNLDARSSAAPSSTAVPNRAELTRETTEEIAQIRATGVDPATSEPTTTTGSAPATDPVATDKHWWNKFTHWGTAKVSALALAVAGGTTGGVLGFLAGACASFGAFLCAAVATMATATAAALGVRGSLCLADHHDYLYIKIPDVTNSHCGD